MYIAYNKPSLINGRVECETFQLKRYYGNVITVQQSEAFVEYAESACIC